MSDRTDRPLVGLFVKVPRPGDVKTRLGKRVGMEAAADFYAGCVAWTLERLREASLETRVFYTPRGGEEILRSMYDFRGQTRLIPQRGGDLGARMFHALRRMKEDTGGVPLVLGSDLPAVPLERVRRAGVLAREVDVVLGPSTDGGYYLVGMRDPRPDPFKGIRWSQPSVLEDTLERIHGRGWSYRLLEEWNDLDDAEDLRKYGSMDS